jgi:DNA helicase-2/ATP-dependent DNA helicase PcrA
MERIEVIAQVAGELRAVHDAGVLAPEPDTRSAALVERLCVSLKIDIRPAPQADPMLGGARARLQLWFWDQPQYGGMIWIRSDLPPEQRTFALAHELGHYALHRGEGVSLHPVCQDHDVEERTGANELRDEGGRVEEYTPRARRELEANAFAAELLAPRAAVRQLFATESGVTPERAAVHFGISRTLARQRLVDAVLAARRPARYGAATADATGSAGASMDASAGEHRAAALLATLDEAQLAAARAEGPALVVAGPGTGKTATLVGRAAHLLVERGRQPERVLALTFSNRAAGEMRERLLRAGLPGGRMPVMTLHAFAAALLREYHHRVPCAPGERPLDPAFRILDQADAFLLMEEILAELPLHHYRSLGSPTQHLRTLLDDFSRARDALLTPAEYLRLVEAMPLAPETLADDPPAHGRAGTRPARTEGTFTADDIARARERALAYAVWDRTLRQRGLLDFGSIIQRAVELLRADAAVRAEVRQRFVEVLVDEFQDTNRAAWELLTLLAEENGRELWLVGDRNQSIYRWRGASPANLERLIARYPGVRVYSLRRCHRSVPELVRLGSAMAARMAALATSATSAAEQAAAEPPFALTEALRPLELAPVRQPVPAPAFLRCDTFQTAAHEQAGIGAAVRRHRAQGYAFGEQAVLCRSHRQVFRLAATLEAAGIPVALSGGFFDRPEVKDLLALLLLAAGPDARGLLRVRSLIVVAGYPQPPVPEAVAVVRRLVRTAPDSLARPETLAALGDFGDATREALALLGEVAAALRYGDRLADTLVEFLLRPHGYAWQLVRVADGVESQGSSRDPHAVVGMSSASAQTSLAALGELVHLVSRFDARWASEDDFRQRLSLAVRHRRGVQPAPASAAAGQDGAEELPPSGATPEDEDADAPAVRCFLHYLRALRAAGVEVVVPAGEDDAVRVLTLHASKGLEFPVVYLPGLAQGQFPPRPSGLDVVSPPGFREDDASTARLEEERCLFYVGVTRARDVVVLTRAGQYGARKAGPSPLLELLDGLPDQIASQALFNERELAVLASDTGESETPAADDEDVELLDAAAPRADVRQSSSRRKPRYWLHDLQRYLECPQQYKYARYYGLLDPAEDAVHRFFRYVVRGRRTLHELQRTAGELPWEHAEPELATLWESEGPVGHAYEPFYRRHAWGILRREWQQLASARGALTGLPGIAETLRAELRGCIVELTADRVDTSPEMADDPETPAPVVLVRQRTGRPRTQDRDDLALPLYYLAFRQRYPDQPVTIKLAYAGSSLSEAEVPVSTESVPADVDVTLEARKAAETYLNPLRRARSRLDKLDEAAAGIAAGLFAPRPEERRCASCAFHIICPADPEATPLSPPEEHVARESAS